MRTIELDEIDVIEVRLGSIEKSGHASEVRFDQEIWLSQKMLGELSFMKLVRLDSIEKSGHASEVRFDQKIWLSQVRLGESSSMKLVRLGLIIKSGQDSEKKKKKKKKKRSICEENHFKLYFKTMNNNHLHSGR
ncbi:hypothetical protein QR98_0062350 [Sarcoptes scabiei]|uniref:Uncharacterized protein n=1 Tax=Sarcoptes scabiei TaxID=52283 RepID=A0A132AAW9_SARSC|nr:hypothetical protein QR98_0062350 [Sarcoptes scabiei]